jgi:hypothetical protein
MTPKLSEGDTLTVNGIEQKGTLSEPVDSGTPLEVARIIGERLILVEYHEENESLPKRQVTAYEGEGDDTLLLGNRTGVNFHQIVTVE